MPRAECNICGGTFHWRWEEAFEKFGFGDGTNAHLTEEVVHVLERASYTGNAYEWGCHNTVIDSIRKDGAELIPLATRIGYDNPRDYLPKDIIALLDKAFPKEEAAS